MTSDQDLVELTTASTVFEAEWLVGALKGDGIAAVTFGDQLADEFAMSQKLMGLGGGVRVMVTRAQLERARQALVAIEKNRPSPEELEAAVAEVGDDAEAEQEEPADPPAAARRGGGRAAILVALSAAVLGLGWIALSQYRRLAGWERASPVTSSTWRGNQWQGRWRHNGALASVYFDRNQNGVFEEGRSYDREGRLISTYYDENENEIWELTIELGADGIERCRLIDANENLIDERLEYPAVDGVQERWLDVDEDFRYERREFVDTASGTVLDAFEDRGRQGFVRVE